MSIIDNMSSSKLLEEKTEYLICRAYYEAGIAVGKYIYCYYDVFHDTPICLYRPERMTFHRFYKYSIISSLKCKDCICEEINSLAKVLSDDENKLDYRKAINFYYLPFLIGQMSLLKHKADNINDKMIFDEITPTNHRYLSLLYNFFKPKDVMDEYREGLKTLVPVSMMEVNNNWEKIERIKNGLLFKGILYENDIKKLFKCKDIINWNKEYSDERAFNNATDSIRQLETVAIQCLDNFNQYKYK